MSVAYPGIGRPLLLSTYSGPSSTSQITYPEQPILADETLSDSEATNNAQNISIIINYNVVPTATTTIQFDSVPTFVNAITLDTIPASATDKVAIWSTQNNYIMPGFIRVYNSSDVQINSIFVQKTVASVG